MEKINFENLPGTATPLNASNLNKMQENIETEINNRNLNNVITGQETETNEYIDGSQVYRKRINLGAFTNATSKTVAHYIENPTFVRMEIFANNGNGTYQSMAHRPGFNAYATSTAIVFNPAGDYSAYTGYADLYYTKN